MRWTEREVGYQKWWCFGKLKQLQSPEQRTDDCPDELHHSLANLLEQIRAELCLRPYL